MVEDLCGAEQQGMAVNNFGILRDFAVTVIVSMIVSMTVLMTVIVAVIVSMG